MNASARLAAAARIGVVATAVWTGACGPLHPCFTNCTDPLPAEYEPDPAAPTTIVTLEPVAPWIETMITVREGERLLFIAVGDVRWDRNNRSTGPDGYKGIAGWNVGPGGLIAKVGTEGKPFNIGARVGLFPDRHPRPPHHPFPPPPLKMPRDGTLYLGFKEFRAGANTGTFTVTISKALKVS